MKLSLPLSIHSNLAACRRIFARQTGFNNLAGLLRVTNRLAEAEPLYRRAAIIFLHSFGPEHPSSILICRNYVTSLLQINHEPDRWISGFVSMCAEAGVDTQELWNRLQ